MIVVAALDGCESFAVTDVVPPFSEIDVAANTSVTEGAPSSSVMVSVSSEGSPATLWELDAVPETVTPLFGESVVSFVAATVTANAAKLLRMEDALGSLGIGREADVSVLDVLKGRFLLSDNSGAEVVTDTLLRPAFCLRGGMRIDADSPLVPPAIEAAA